jgi:hypothetical protein
VAYTVVQKDIFPYYLINNRIFERRFLNINGVIRAFYLPTDAQDSCFKNNIKIYNKTAPTCFGAVTPSSGSVLFELAKVTVVKIANYCTSVCGGVAAATSPHTDVF